MIGPAAFRARPWLVGIVLALALQPGIGLAEGAPATRPGLAQAQALLAEGKAEDAFELLSALEDRFVGDLQFDYLLARAALESGRPSLASFIYERILAVEPRYVGVRLEYGRAYLELQNYARAKQEFELVLGFENLPRDLRATAEQYARIAEAGLTPKRTFYNLFAEYGFGHDDNVNRAAGESVASLPGGVRIVLEPQAVREADLYQSLMVGGQLVHALTNEWQLIGAVDYQARFHRSDTVFDFHYVEGRAGVRHVTEATSTRALARAGRFYADDDRLLDTWGGTVEWLHALDARNQVSTSASFTRFRYIGDLEQTSDFDAYAVSAFWNHAFADGRALLGLAANLGYEVETGGRLDGDKVQAGLTLTLQASLTQSVGAFVVAGFQRDNYQSRNDVFGIQRHDNVLTAGGGLSWAFAKGWSLRPQVSWTDSDSNVTLSTYDRLDVSLNLRKDI